MEKKTVEILVGVPLEGAADPGRELPSYASPADAPDGGAAGVAGRQSQSQMVMCPYCHAVSYVLSVEALPGWTTCNRCGQSFAMN